MLEPIGKFNSYLPEVRNAITKREKKVSNSSLSITTLTRTAQLSCGCGSIRSQLLDYDAARAKARKLSSKDSDPVTLRAVRTLMLCDYSRFTRLMVNISGSYRPRQRKSKHEKFSKR